ncbi:MAG: hypothetical protein HOO96_36660 [Polyangiaceae bacterium]|nr:hypothetical protein [Polyangiaceae bacterium]
MGLVRALISNPRWVFLLDGCGALLTGGLLMFVLVPLERHFGVPAEVLRPLAFAAGVFALYSLGCFAGFSRIAARYRPFLGAIALANSVYCATTWAILMAHRDRVTSLGVAYFAVESAIVALVVALEVATVRRPRAAA